MIMTVSKKENLVHKIHILILLNIYLYTQARAHTHMGMLCMWVGKRGGGRAMGERGREGERWREGSENMYLAWTTAKL